VLQGNHNWLSIRTFETTAECIEALRDAQYEIWATDLSQYSQSLDDEITDIPNKVAIIIGRESDGVSSEMLQAADKRIYLPIFGLLISRALSRALSRCLMLSLLHRMYPFSVSVAYRIQ
jgi:tRNA (guanosine-2'-O-)-methyltransferase